MYERVGSCRLSTRVKDNITVCSMQWTSDSAGNVRARTTELPPGRVLWIQPQNINVPGTTSYKIELVSPEGIDRLEGKCGSVLGSQMAKIALYDEATPASAHGADHVLGLGLPTIASGELLEFAITGAGATRSATTVIAVAN